MATLTHVELITPERVLFSGEAEAVVMRTNGGDITFLANHMDYIGVVDICIVRIEGIAPSQSPDGPPAPDRAAPGEKSEAAPPTRVRAAVHGGFVMVCDNTVRIATGVAELAEEIDVGRAERALEAAEAATQASEEGAEDFAEAMARARVRLEAAAAPQGTAVGV